MNVFQAAIEAELQTRLKKSDFEEMQIIGQFNKVC